MHVKILNFIRVTIYVILHTLVLKELMKQLDILYKKHDGLLLDQSASTQAISQDALTISQVAVSSNITIHDPKKVRTKG